MYYFNYYRVLLVQLLCRLLYSQLLILYKENIGLINTFLHVDLVLTIAAVFFSCIRNIRKFNNIVL